MISLFRRRRTHDDFADEVQAHLDLETDRLVAEGWSLESARREAYKAFGNATLVKERFYEASRWVLLEQFGQDVRYAWRSLRHSPAFFATVALTLTIGLGLVTVAFTVFNAYVLRPYAIRTPSSLHTIGWLSETSGGMAFRWNDYLELKERRDLFDDVVAEHARFVTSNGHPMAAVLVSGNYFDALGPRVLLGRAFSDGDTDHAAVLSQQAWRRIYASDPSVIGRTLDLNGHQFTIVAVLRPEFTGLGDYPRDVWVPLTMYAPIASPDLTGTNQSRAIELNARLRLGISRERAESALSPFMRREEEAPRGEEVRAVIEPATPNPFSAQMLAVLAPVVVAFGLVLATVCANVSNVMLARGVARHREIAVRLSLGASRGRVVRQLVTEGLVIACVAGLGALVLASFAIHLGTMTFFGTLPPSIASIVRLVPIDLDYRVFAFAMLASVAATAMFALMPALQASRLPLMDAIRGNGGTAQHGSRLRHALVIGQVAVSLVLVTLAVTLARNGAAIGAIDQGFMSAGVMSINVRGEEGDLIRRLVPVLTADPRVAEVAATGGNPLFVRTRNVAAAPAGRSTARPTRYTFVAPEYFSLLRIPIVQGRGFLPDEARSAAHVVIVSAATARAFWPGEDAIGKTIRIERAEGRPVDELPGYSQVTVVGTAPDVVSGLIVDGSDSGHIYLPMTADDPHATAALVRGRTAQDLGPDTLQTLFSRVAQDPQVFEALPLDEMRELQIYPLKAASWVGFLLGGLALILSVSGLYGILIYTINQRTKEIGIRMALGATASGVVRLVMRQSARLAALGAAVGMVAAYGLLRTVSSVIQLQTISFLDAAAFLSSLVLVLGAAVLAAYQPARRATRIDPSLALRADA